MDGKWEGSMHGTEKKRIVVDEREIGRGEDE